MLKKYYFIIYFLLFTYSVKAQINLSVYSEISLVTAGPGEELYEAFGHSAIRIKDPVLQLDLIYNYGIFDFNRPNFYTNFAKGNMIYSLARYDFKYFLASYKRDKRWVKQQVLNLTQQEKQAFFQYLENNALPKNKDYLYDPYFNNCATKPRDITKSILEDDVIFNNKNLNKDLSFRELTNNEIHWNTWGSLGLNLVVGNKLDQKATPEEYQFLPDYSLKAFNYAKINRNKKWVDLVIKEEILLNFKEKKPKIETLSPFLILSIISILGIWLTYRDLKHNKRTRLLDFSLFFITGLIGLFLVLLWLFSTHEIVQNNFNILWLVPLNLVVSFFLLKKKSLHRWILYYIQFLVLLVLSIPVLWFLKIQVFPPAIVPILMILLIRYIFLSKKLLPSIK